MRGHRSVLLAWLLAFPASTWARQEEEPPYDAMEDDADDAVQRARERISAEGTPSASLGIVMVSSVKDRGVSDLTIPIWKEYCRRHKMGFFHQEELLLTGELPFKWTKVRVLLEVLPLVKWKYMLLIDHNSLPKTMGKSWEYMVKEHMRFRRYANDKTDTRKIFCPWDCEEEYENPFEDGACSGPALHGCILWAKKPATRKLVQVWHAKRKNSDFPRDATGVLKALHELQRRNHEYFYLRDVAKEVGKRDSKFIPVFSWDKVYGWNIREQIADFIKRDKVLSDISNEAQLASEKKKQEL